MDDHEDTPRDDRYNALFSDEPGKAHIAVLANDLKQSAAPTLRWRAADELAELGLTIGATGCSGFAEALQDDSCDGALRMTSAKTLAGLGPVSGDIGARALAKTLLKEENDTCLRSLAADSLGKLMIDAGAVGVLALGRVVETDPDVVLRRQAAASLGAIGLETSVRAAERAAVPGLAKGLLDSDVTVRWRSAESLGELGYLAGDAGAAALGKALLEDTEVGTRRRAAASMALLGATVGANAAALVQAYRKDTHDVVKNTAHASIMRIRVASVIALSSSEHDYIRGRAAWAMGELEDLAGDDVIEELLRALTQEPELYVRRRVLEAIGKLGKCIGELGAAALARARGDGDVFISTNAMLWYDDLGLESTEAGVLALERLLAGEDKLSSQVDIQASVTQVLEEGCKVAGADAGAVDTSVPV